MKDDDESNERHTHDENHGRAKLDARRVVGEHAPRKGCSTLRPSAGLLARATFTAAPSALGSTTVRDETREFEGKVISMRWGAGGSRSACVERKEKHRAGHALHSRECTLQNEARQLTRIPWGRMDASEGFP